MYSLKEIINSDLQNSTEKYSRGTILQKPGETASHAYYVKSGLLRSYTLDDKGKEHTYMFAPEDWIIADMESQEFGNPAKLYIECLEDSEVVAIGKDFFKNQKLDPEQLKDQIDLLSRRVGILQQRVIMLMSASAAERYEKFIHTYPSLQNRLTLKMIASYIGITPEALSKLRGQRVGK